MLRTPCPVQHELEMVTLESLVPADHLLRKIASAIDFDFIRDRVAHLYCADNGRPALDPVMLFKLLFIGYLFGIRSERQLMREVQVNVAYRWFLNLSLTDKVPDHSTISQNRRRRFNGTDVFRKMFDDVVHYAYSHKFIDGTTLYTDSTHLKANANKKKFVREIVCENTKAYLEELDQAVEDDRKAHGKKPLAPKKTPDVEPEKEIKISKTDPESGYLAREGKPEGFHFLDHRTCDNQHNMITDVYVTAGNVNDSTVYLERLHHQIERFGFVVQAVGLDSGYHTAHICKTLIEKGIFSIISYRKPGGSKGLFRRSKFVYDHIKDHYTCLQGHVLKYRSTNRSGFLEYSSDRKICGNCPRLAECTNSKNHQKIVTRHVWEKYYEEVKENRKTERGEYIKRRRSETIERSFADAKQLHGYRYARFRGIEKVESQALMTAIAQNIKKMVLLMTKHGHNPNGNGKGGGNSSFSSLLSLITVSIGAKLRVKAVIVVKYENPLYAISIRY